MEIKSNIYQKENTQYTSKLIEDKRNRSNIFDMLKDNKESFFTIKKIINLSIIPILFYIYYYIMIKDDYIEEPNSLGRIISEEEDYSFIDIKPSELVINNSTINRNESLIIGINIGALNSEYSYYFRYTNSNIISEKSKSTELELSKETKKGMKYSSTASVSLKNYKSSELNKIIFIKDFQTMLYNDENIFYEYNNDNNVDIVNIYKEYLNLFKKDILSEVEKNKEKNYIKWIIALPENINQFEKQLIKNITTELEMYNMKFIYESEAASMTIQSDKYIPNSVKQKNKVFLLINVDGYTIDLSVYKIIDDIGSLKQIISTQSYNLGILDIINKIINILKDVFGKKTLDKIKKNEPGNWLNFLNDINKAIENTNNINGNQTYTINNKIECKEGNYDYKGYTIKVDKYKIDIPLSLIRNILFNNIDIIIGKINNIIKDLNERKIKINNIVVIGGLSKNQILKKKLDNNFNNTENFIHYLSLNENILSKGAVIYGNDTNKKIYRISPITLGIRKNDINNKKEKIELLIKKGEEINNHLIKYIKPNSDEQEEIKINVYISNENLKKINELEEHLEGRIILKLDKKNKGMIKLVVNYDTVISFHANYENKKQVESYFEFYKL